MAEDTGGAAENERQLILDAQSKGRLATLGAYTRLSGPGWLQSAITLGGGSLAGSLYLGIFGGFALLWAQPVAMALGVIMLSAISYVTLSTGERPFQAINRHVNPVLGWGWAIATLMANLVWSLPQFSLGAAALRQNLVPSVLSKESVCQKLGWDVTVAGNVAMADNVSKLIACGGILLVCVFVVLSYDSGRKGVRFFEYLLKALVGVIVVCFFGVVIKLTFSGEGLQWSQILRGFIPDFNMLWAPASAYVENIQKVVPEFRQFWTDMVVSQQRDVIITVTATAVGINMTFLLPYSMLKRGWDRDFRGLAIFDLSTGLFVPFILATSCVVIASASQFHAKAPPGFLGEKDADGKLIEPSEALVGKFDAIALQRVRKEIGEGPFEELEKLQDKEKKEAQLRKWVEELPEADRRMAASLVKRDAFDLANALAPLTGDVFAQYAFGIGVVSMAVSSIIILMLINGFVVCEMLGLESKGWPHRLGAMMPAIGALAPFIWTGGKAQFWLAVPTSVFGITLIPIAYCTFLLVMNQKKLLGDNMPRGGKRVAWNVLMVLAIVWTGIGSIYAVWSKSHWYGITGVLAFITLAVIVHFMRAGRRVD